MNKAIHILCVPAIYGSALILLNQIALPVPAVVSSALTTLALPAASAALPVALFYGGYWSYLTGPSFVGASASALAVGALWGVGAWGRALGSNAIRAAVGVHVFSWIAQFYGHGAHEGRAPALLDNLFDAVRVSTDGVSTHFRNHSDSTLT